MAGPRTNGRKLDRMLALIDAAEARVRALPEHRRQEGIHEERRALLRAFEDPWVAGHVGYCLEERLLRKNKAQGCGAHRADGRRGIGDHECVLEAAHPGGHRCACGKAWPKP